MPAEIAAVMSKLDLGEASQEMLTWAKENIREDPDTRCQMLEEFKDMIYSRGECTPHRTDDAFLLRFLRSRKFSLEGAYRLIVNYYAFKEENKTYFKGVNFKCLELAGESDVISVPPYRDQTGKRILWYKVGKWQPESFTIDDFFRASFMILELAVLEESAQIQGGICIVDCADMSTQQILHMTPNIARKIVQVSVTSHPMKLEAMHIVNQSWICDAVFNIFKPFLHEKMKERIFFHGNDMESLHKHVDPKCLPEIYGGLQPHYNYRDWIQWFRSDRTILKEMESLGYSISKNGDLE